MEKPPEYTSPNAQRGFGLQCAIAVSVGMTSVVAFSAWRRKWPRLYAARAFRRPELPALDTTLFGWIRTLYFTTDRQVLESAGLDAYVFLKFFEAAIALLWRLAAVSLFVIGPLRWYYLGQYGDDGPDYYIDPLARQLPEGGNGNNGHRSRSAFGDYQWVYLVFTYVFTLICFRVMRRYTNEVVLVRQEYLGHQNSITDRTLRITGIPRKMRSQAALSDYLTRLFGTEPQNVILCRDWSRLDELSRSRSAALLQLEKVWGDYLGAGSSDVPTGERSSFQLPGKARPRGHVGKFGIFGPRVDLINFYTVKLASLDQEIREQRELSNDMPVMATAFATMKSASDCQLAAQALLSPRPDSMISSLAPSPHDVIWKNTYLSPMRRKLYNYGVALIVLITGAFLIIPLTYLASLLDMEIIEKLAPKLADILRAHEWLQAFVTEVLPTFVYTIFNLVIPYLYAFLSTCQGYVSREDVELSTVSKNFFFVFVNLFLVFTVSSAYLSTTVVDTTEIARGFAESLRKLSTFYTNLIVLQGLGLMPLRLLQAGSLVQHPFFVAQCRSARDRHELYKPSTLNYGILLPTSLLIFIVVIVYSIIRKRIVFFGTIYFILGYFVYKFLCLYSMVHPQHSNGRLWTLIMRRVYVGIAIFHLAMIGTLALQAQYTYAILILPLTVSLGGVWYNFEKTTEPLLRFIAIEALMDLDDAVLDSYYLDDSDVEQNSVMADLGDISSSTALGRSGGDAAAHESALIGSIRHRASRTLDEGRELHLKYVNRNLVAPLDGPWVATDGDERIIAESERGDFIRKPIDYDEWE